MNDVDDEQEGPKNTTTLHPFKRSEVYTSSKWYCMEAILEAEPHILLVYFYKNNTDELWYILS